MEHNDRHAAETGARVKRERCTETVPEVPRQYARDQHGQTAGQIETPISGSAEIRRHAVSATMVASNPASSPCGSPQRHAAEHDAPVVGGGKHQVGGDQHHQAVREQRSVAHPVGQSTERIGRGAVDDIHGHHDEGIKARVMPPC